MKMLSLTKHTAKVASVNPRSERHGDDNVLACDIKLEFSGHSKLLDCFDEVLRPTLFRKAAVGEQQRIDGDELTGIRINALGPLTWTEEYPGYRLRFDIGLGLKKEIEVDVELRKFKFEPHEGGSVDFTVSALCHPDAATIGRLCDLIQDEVQITLIPPAAQSNPADVSAAA